MLTLIALSIWIPTKDSTTLNELNGQAIIATEVGGTAEILTDQVSGILVPPDDLEALTAAIQRMLTDREFRTRLGQQARTLAMEKFSLPTASAHIRMFWKSFL